MERARGAGLHLRVTPLALLLLVVFLVVPASAAVPLLGGTNVITGSASRSMQVHLARASTIDARGFSDYTITGGGRFAGIVLADARGRAGTVLALFHFNDCWAAACAASRPEPFGYLKDSRDEPTSILPPGDYTLHLIADGTPVRVVLRLHGVSGSASFRPTGRSVVSIGTLGWGLAIGPTPFQEIYTAGGTGAVFGRGGIVATNFQFEGSNYIGSGIGVCLYAGAGPKVFLPGCPGRSGVDVPFLDLVSAPNYRAGIVTMSFVQPHQWTVESYYVGAALVREAHASSFWLSL